MISRLKDAKSYRRLRVNNEVTFTYVTFVKDVIFDATEHSGTTLEVRPC